MTLECWHWNLLVSSPPMHRRATTWDYNYTDRWRSFCGWAFGALDCGSSWITCVMSRGTVEPTVRDMASAVTLWVEHRTLKSPLSRYKTCSNPAVCFEHRGNSLTLRCSISLSCTKEYLAVDSGGYMCLNTLHCLAASGQLWWPLSAF
jgi:hypothetical protein